MVNSLVQWRDWSRDTFAHARDADLPVLLVLEQFWCGLSRMLHVTAWNNPEIAAVLNSRFIPIRVDASRMPDVDRRFRASGWPALVFLTPDPRPIAASGFMPPDVLLNALQNVDRLYHSRTDEITERITEMEEALDRQRASLADGGRSPSPWMTTAILEKIRQSADPDYGGFGDSPRFPQFDALELLLRLQRILADKSLLELVTQALDGMTQNGLYDWDMGGYFRMSDEPDWSSPSYEKLLTDQARHIRTSLWAFQATGDTEYREAAEGVLDYCRNSLYDPSRGVFANSQAADADFYLSGERQRRSLPAPEIDTTVFLGSNAQMLRSLYMAAPLLQDESLADMATRCLEALLLTLAPEGEFAFRYSDGEPRVQGLLGDQVDLGLALLDAYQHTGVVRYLTRAAALADMIDERLSDSRRPGYFDAEDPGGLRQLGLRDKCYEENMQLSVFFSTLGWLQGDTAWLDRARSALSGFTGLLERLGVESAAFGLGLLQAFSEPLLVDIACGHGLEQAQSLIVQAVIRTTGPLALVRWVEPADGTPPVAVRRGEEVLGTATTAEEVARLFREAMEQAAPAQASGER